MCTLLKDVDPIDPLQKDPPLFVAMSNEPWCSNTMHSHAAKQKLHRGVKRKLTTRQHTNLQITFGLKIDLSFKIVILKEIQTINTILWLFNVSWQIAVARGVMHSFLSGGRGGGGGVMWHSSHISTYVLFIFSFSFETFLNALYHEIYWFSTFIDYVDL